MTELEDGTSVKITAPKSSAAYKNGEREETFHFSNVFGTKSSQEDVYKDVARPIVSSLLMQDCHGLIFTFGVTNSGKTHTIHGSDEEPGILPRALQDIFNSIKKTGSEETRFPIDDANYKYAVVVNYLEIYNELIYDLLSDFSGSKIDPQREALDLKMDTKGRIGVRGLRDVTVTSYDQAINILKQGRQNRQVAETKLNTDSSRSHSIFTIKLCTVPKEHVVPMSEVQKNPGQYVRYTKLSVIDLAGSERTKRTNNQGARLVEASNINQSLMTFKRCIDALRYNQMHPNRPSKAVPFRDSKMTRLFQDYFTGHGKATMIVNVNPQISDYDETLRVMKFSAMAKDIKIATSRIDTGRVQKTKSRLNTERFDGNMSQIGVTPAKQPATAKKPEPTASSRKMVEKKQEELKKQEAAKDKEAKSQNDAAVANLESTIESLKEELAASLAANVRLEASIREEVASEFAQEIFRNQLQCEERVMEMRECLEEKYEKKILILDELNKTSMQRHAQKYQELVSEYNDLADEYEHREMEMQQKLDALLSAKSSGNVAKYNQLIKQLEQKNTQLENQVKDLQEAQQEWKKQVGQIAETRIAQLENENAELKEELKQSRLKTTKKRFGLKKKQNSRENLDGDEKNAEEMNEDGWANISLDVDEDQEKNDKAKGKKKFGMGGSWRKRKAENPILQSQPTNAASTVPTKALTDKDIYDLVGSKKPKSSAEENVAPTRKRQESDSMMLGDLLNIGDQNQSHTKTSPLLQKRSVSRASGPTNTAERGVAEFPPVIVPQPHTKNNTRSRKPPSKFLF